MARLWTSAYLLSRVRDKIFRPENDPLSSDARLFRAATDAQTYWFQTVSTRLPALLAAPWKRLVTDDDGLTYYFTNNATPTPERIAPLAVSAIMESRGGGLILPGSDWQADRYMIEGDHIVWPGGIARTFADGPWGRWVNPPGVINAATDPELPDGLCPLLMYRTAIEWAPQEVNTDGWVAKEETYWSEAVKSYRTQHFAQGAEGVDIESPYWWHSSDLGRAPS